MAVHLPIAMMLVWPLVDAVGLVTGRRDVCFVAMALLGLGLVSSLFATVTGQAAFDAAAASGVSVDVLETHTSDADLVPWLVVVCLAVRTAGVKKLGRAGHWAAILLGLAIAVFVGTVGFSGGDLVYDHGVGVRAAEVTP